MQSYKINFAKPEKSLTFAVPNTVDVVQLVEHRIVVPSVVGSSPIIHPPSKACNLQVFFCIREKSVYLS